VRRWLSRAVTLGGLLVAATALASPAWADQPPYSDPAVEGTLTLCDQDLQRVTSGAVTDRPTVWRAVGSVPAPSPYDGEGRKASLWIFQPRKGIPAGEWTGVALTAASRYQDPSHPMAQSSLIDLAMAVRLDAYPPQWDGWMQLRLLYSAPNTSVAATYAAADLRIQGDRWTLVGGGTDDCGSADDAVSPEVLLPYYSKSAKAVAKQQAGQATSSAGASPSASSSRTTPSPTPAAAGDGAASNGGSDETSSALPWVVGALTLVVVALLVAALVWSRRSGPTGQHR
jgi:hypothetical protein